MTTVGQVWAVVLNEAGWRQARRDVARVFRWRRCLARGERYAGVVPPKDLQDWLMLAWRLRGFESGAQVGRTVAPPEGGAGFPPPGWVFVLWENGQTFVGNPGDGQVYLLASAPAVVH